jgi:hypothetical protein
MRYLKDVFTHIWAAVHLKTEHFVSANDVRTINKEINTIVAAAHEVVIDFADVRL